jgi:uncharacterized protein YdiU (UPF0061 family)
LADYIIAEHFPALGVPTRETYARWFEEISLRTAVMVAEWMRVGFVHGVMNTDNMSILGLTIDYGPYGWLEGYDTRWTPNTTDAAGRRYAYGNQPQIALWNLARLASALFPLIEDKGALEQGLTAFREKFEGAWDEMLSAKLGIARIDEDDEKLVTELFGLLEAVETDMTLFFRSLATLPLRADVTDAALVEPLKRAFYADDASTPDYLNRLSAWLRGYIARVDRDELSPHDRIERMNRANPKYVLRNYLAQQAIDALEAGDASVMTRLMKVLERPYDEQPEHDQLAERRPEWARHRPGCSALSCSS